MHRPGDPAFRRGLAAGEGPEQGGRSAYRPYRPEPEDQLLNPGGAADQSAEAHVDNTPPGFDDRPPPPAVPPVVALTPPPSVTPPVAPPSLPFAAVIPPKLPAEVPAPEPPAAAPPPIYAPPPAPLEPPTPPEPTYAESTIPPPPPPAPEEPYDDFDAYENRYTPSRDDRDRPAGGMSALAIGGFVLLGILAIGVGAFISGIFGGGVAQATPSPTPTVSISPSSTPEATPTPTPNASVAASLNPTATPIPLPDGFTARTEPCAEQPTKDGCGSSGTSVSGGTVWVWIGWSKGSDADTLGVEILDASGDTVAASSLALSLIGSNGCGPSCNGYGRFRFTGLEPGNYTIRIDRNDEVVAEATFTVTT